MGASTDAERRPVSHPRSSNRTCRFPASGFPTGFTVDSRTRSTRHRATASEASILRLAIQLDRKGPDPTVFAGLRQSPHLPSFTNTPEARALSSAGVTRPHRSYGPLRLPDWPPPFLTTLEARPSTSPEPPPLAADRLPHMPCSLPRWIGSGARWLTSLRVPARVSSLSVQPSPFLRRAGIHNFTFEACSSFNRVTACKVAHPPFAGFIARLRPCRFPGSNARKLSSPTNNYLSGSFPHW